MRASLAAPLLLAALLAACNASTPAAPSPTGRPATLPGTPRLTSVEWAPAGLELRFTTPADGATPLRYELRCESASDPLVLSADAAAALSSTDTERTLRLELLPSDPVPTRCTLLAWATRGYGPPSEPVAVRPAPLASPTPSPSGSAAPLATASFTAGLLPAFDPAACLTPPPPPSLAAREPSSGSPLVMSLAPGRFAAARLRDGGALAAPSPIVAITPSLAAPSLRLRAGDRLELRVTGGLLAAATIELYEATVLVDGSLLLDPLRRRFAATGPGSANPAAESSNGTAAISLTLDPSLPAGRYLLVVGGTAHSPCAVYTPERSLLLLEAVGGFAPPTPTPSPTPSLMP